MKLFLFDQNCDKKLLTKLDTSFHQRLPNLVQHLFADVIYDANIHEQKYL